MDRPGWSWKQGQRDLGHWQHSLRRLNGGITASYPHTHSNAQESHSWCCYSRGAWHSERMKNKTHLGAERVWNQQHPSSGQRHPCSYHTLRGELGSFSFKWCGRAPPKHTPTKVSPAFLAPSVQNRMCHIRDDGKPPRSSTVANFETPTPAQPQVGGGLQKIKLHFGTIGFTSSQCSQVREFSPHIRGFHASDGAFQFPFGEFWLLNSNFKRNTFMEMGNFKGFFKF